MPRSTPTITFGEAAEQRGVTVRVFAAELSRVGEWTGADRLTNRMLADFRRHRTRKDLTVWNLLSYRPWALSLGLWGLWDGVWVWGYRGVAAMLDCSTYYVRRIAVEPPATFEPPPAPVFPAEFGGSHMPALLDVRETVMWAQRNNKITPTVARDLLRHPPR